MNTNLYAVILCGGSGTRFWPLSRRNFPKQFLRMTGDGSLLQQTVKRILPMVPAANVLVVTNRAYKKTIQTQLSSFQIPSHNLLLEPEARNTAPAILWAAAHIQAKSPQATMMVLPSDHLITQDVKFLGCLKQAVDLAQQDYLVTLGIAPTRPETGYGYLKVKPLSKGKAALRVERFVEKPDHKTAVSYVKSKAYLWNSGMFIWKSRTILDAYAKLLPEMAALIVPNYRPTAIGKVWAKCQSISVDYGILEKADNVAALAAPAMGWSDLGSWEALHEINGKDADGNALKGDVVTVDARHVQVFGNKKLIALIGVDNLTVVDTPDALLICRTPSSQKVKDVVEALKKGKRECF